MNDVSSLLLYVSIMTMVFMMVIELDDFPIEDGDFPWLC